MSTSRRLREREKSRTAESKESQNRNSSLSCNSKELYLSNNDSNSREENGRFSRSGSISQSSHGNGSGMSEAKVRTRIILVELLNYFTWFLAVHIAWLSAVFYNTEFIYIIFSCLYNVRVNSNVDWLSVCLCTYSELWFMPLSFSKSQWHAN